MAVFTYTAVDRGDLAGGHSEGTEYSIELPLSEWSPIKKKDEVVTRSLSGIKSTVLHNIAKKYSFRTVSTDDQSIIDGMEELFDSVAAGEIFSIDPYGSLASPDNPIDVSIDGNHKTKRIGQTEFDFSAKVDVE